LSSVLQPCFPSYRVNRRGCSKLFLTAGLLVESSL
jgi:hypothetical protein